MKAKELIAKHKYLYIPDLRGKSHKVKFKKVEIEKLINGPKYRADAICYLEDRMFIVEIIATSEIDLEKINYLRENNIDTIEIDLRKSIETKVWKSNSYNNPPNDFNRIVLNWHSNFSAICFIKFIS